ncbi:monocarboxylate transporter 12-like [Haliotis rufescens]|uniref:monocarboxylate transporter 12-like n=1 Tax=Haliotis rufescens TaxID=6454 RepID=UPI00201F7366|nr:monocarboxylate transporter 12-like [Haliotis rufescens]XP_048249887.1 monocarboxylate transporter 12-like [Haliotis rufescens]
MKNGMASKVENGAKPTSEASPDPETSQPDSHDDIIPDGGWGWVVCFASFMINFILDGTMFSFGVIMLELLDYFGESKSKTAWVGSTLLGMSMLMGPLVSFLLRRFSCRQVTIFGTLLSTIGFVTSMFAPNVETLIITYGVIGGIGFSMVFLPAIIIVGLYFNKKRAIATGIATSGSGVGTFAYAHICDRLLHAYDWRGTVLILSGFVLNCVVCGFLFRPFVEQKLRQKFKRDKDAGGSSGYGGSSEENESVKSKEDIYECLKPLLSKKYRDAKPDVLLPIDPSNLRQNTTARMTKSAENISRLHVAVPLERLHKSSHNIAMKNSLDDFQAEKIKRGLSKPILRKDIFYSGSIRHLQQFQHCRTLSQFLAEMTQDMEVEEIESIDERCRFKKGWFARLKYTLGTQLFKKPVFLLLLITFTMWTVQSVPLTYVPDYAVSIGLDRSQAAFLISIVGITNTIGRICAGFITDFFNVRSIVTYIFALIVASAVNFVLPWCNSFALLACCAGVFGLCMAVAVSMRTIVLADNLGIEYLTSSFGMVAMFQGMAFTVFPPIGGKLYDVTGSFTSPFMMAGSMYVVSFISTCIVAFLRRSGPAVTVEEEVEVPAEVPTEDNAA